MNVLFGVLLIVAALLVLILGAAGLVASVESSDGGQSFLRELARALSAAPAVILTFLVTSLVILAVVGLAVALLAVGLALL